MKCMRKRISVKRTVTKYNKSVEFNNWISANCKSSTDGLNVQDIDFFFHDFKIKSKPYMFIEVKQFVNTDTFGNRKPCMKPGQHAQFNLLNRVCEASISEFEYRGFFEISISGETPDNSESILILKHFDYKYKNVEFDIDRYQLLRFLNFEITFDELVNCEYV